jgi:hypothetical protein
MQTLIALRWYLLVAALFSGAAMLLPMLIPSSVYWNVRPDALLTFTPFLQGAGVFAMSRALTARGAKAKLAVVLGYVAAAAWLVAVIGGVLAQAAGPGGLVFGFFLVLPGIAIGLLTQIIAIVSFVRAEPRPPAT